MTHEPTCCTPAALRCAPCTRLHPAPRLHHRVCMHRCSRSCCSPPPLAITTSHHTRPPLLPPLPPCCPPPALAPPGSVILSYFSAFTSTPLLMLVPMITVSALRLRGRGAGLGLGWAGRVGWAGRAGWPAAAAADPAPCTRRCRVLHPPTARIHPPTHPPARPPPPGLAGLLPHRDQLVGRGGHHHLLRRHAV